MKEKKIIPALTGIRAICVYLIFFYHLNSFDPILHPNLYLILNQFYTFLTFFFVLSGFLIYHRYGDVRYSDKTKIHNYFVSRISRVFPILLLLITLTFLLALYHGYYDKKETLLLYLLNISLLKGFSSNYFLSGIGPSWSMSVEELFYLLSPILFLYGNNIKSLIITILIFYGLGIVITYSFSLFPNAGFFNSYIFTAYHTFFGRIFEFACGIFLGFLVKGFYPNHIIHRLGKKSLHIGIFIIVISVFLLSLITKKYQIQHAVEVWPGVAVNNILMPVGITFIFYSLIYHNSILRNFLSSKIMVQLGNATYSFYLLHTTFLLSYIYKFIGRNIAVTFITMIIVSYIFYRLVEQPAAVFIKKRFYKKKG